MNSEAETNGTKPTTELPAAINEGPKRIQIKSDIPHYVRFVQTDDIDEITDVAVKTFEKSLLWQYIFPRSKQYPDDHYHHTRMQFQDVLTGALSEPVKFHFVVVERPVNQSDDSSSGNTSNHMTNPSDLSQHARKMKIVAFAIWQLPYTYSFPQTSSASTEVELPKRRDEDVVRKQTWRNEIATVVRPAFNEKFGEKRLTLYNLVTLPECQRKGIGSVLFEWGVQKAKDEGLAITLTSSVYARKLYESFGLREIVGIHIQVEGEKEYLDLPALAKQF